MNEHLTNFTTSLTTFACGRDFYSPIKTCSDCQREYRRWLCTIAFPRCGEASPSDPSFEPPSQSSQTPQRRGRDLLARVAEAIPLTLTKTKRASNPNSTSIPVTSALAPVASTAPSRSPFLPPYNTTYEVLLPCIETCQAADRACPYSLGFKCPPTGRFVDIARRSYGVGIIDGVGHDQERMGSAGVSEDPWGNVWCNSG